MRLWETADSSSFINTDQITSIWHTEESEYVEPFQACTWAQLSDESVHVLAYDSVIPFDQVIALLRQD